MNSPSPIKTDSKDKVSPSEVAALHKAIECGDSEGLIDLIKRDPHTLTALSHSGETPLEKAMKSENIEALKILVQHGVDINVPKYNDHGNTALHLAILRSSTEMVLALLDLGADMKITNDVYQDAMHIACSRNEIKIINDLIHRGLNINEKVDSGTIGYFGYALRFCNKESIEHFLKLGVEPWQIDEGLSEISLQGTAHRVNEMIKGEYQEVVTMVKAYQLAQQEKLALEKIVSDVSFGQVPSGGFSDGAASKKTIRI